MIRIFLLLSTSILFFIFPLQADNLADLPSRWNNQLHPLAVPDISGVEPAAKKAMKEARAVTAKALINPSTGAKELAWAYGNLGNLYQFYTIHQPALSCYDNAQILEPDNFRWIYYDAYLSMISGLSDLAIENFKKASAMEVDYPPIELHMGRLWYETGEFDKANKALITAAEHVGLRPGALYYLGQIALLNRRYQDAITQFEEVIRLDPQASKVYYPLAATYRATGNAQEARRYIALRGKRMPQIDDPLIDELERLYIGGRSFFISALQSVRNGDYNKANQLFKDGLVIDPTNSNARLSLARSLFLAGETDQADKELINVLKQDPNNTLALFLKGITLDLNGEYDKAVKHYKRVIKIDSKHSGGHFYLGNRLLHNNNYTEAASHYSAAMAADAANPLARLFHLVARYRGGADDRTIIEKLEKEIEQQQDPQMFQYALARLLAVSKEAQVRDPARALELSKILAMNQGIPPFLELLALAYAANGDFEQAEVIQHQLVTSMQWLPPGPYKTRLHNMLINYRQGSLHLSQPWPDDDSILMPPPVDAVAVFLEYPAPISF